jgi:hypothetical protein
MTAKVSEVVLKTEFCSMGIYVLTGICKCTFRFVSWLEPDLRKDMKGNTGP